MNLKLPETADIAIVGAGAAGLAAAIFARRANGSRSVVVLERARKPGAKILVSGGSRCNVTNAIVADADFWGGSRAIIRRVLRTFPVDETVAFFAAIGVTLHEEAGGKLFPDSNRSRDVLDALLRETTAQGAALHAGHRVEDVVADPNGFRIVTPHGELRAPRIVLATGGRSLPKSGSDGAGIEMARRLGHNVVSTTPALTPLLLAEDDDLHRRLSGVAHDAELSIWIDGARSRRIAGALLWTHFGVSGPVALDASRHWLRAQIEGRTPAITVNFRGGASFDAIERTWIDLALARPRASVQHVLSGIMPASVASAWLPTLGLDGSTPLAHVSRGDRRTLAHALAAWPLPVVGARGYAAAEATAGGVSLAEIDPATMESRVRRGLFLVGEMLDVDGRLGGFNFQWAWSSGKVAGSAVAR